MSRWRKRWTGSSGGSDIKSVDSAGMGKRPLKNTILPSRQDVVEAIEKQPDLIRLESGGCYCNRWSITIITEKKNRR